MTGNEPREALHLVVDLVVPCTQQRGQSGALIDGIRVRLRDADGGHYELTTDSTADIRIDYG